MNNHMMSKLLDSIMSNLKPNEFEVIERIQSALRVHSFKKGNWEER